MVSRLYAGMWNVVSNISVRCVSVGLYRWPSNCNKQWKFAKKAHDYNCEILIENQILRPSKEGRRKIVIYNKTLEQVPRLKYLECDIFHKHNPDI